jgi:pimeloyl-ACP methyl ester carboxylesterase
LTQTPEQTPERLADLHPIRVLDVDGRPAIRYLDTGEPGWPAVVFFGGLGTSAGAFSLTEFARVQRRRLRLRFVSVERNGFGDTPFMPGIGFQETVDDVLTVLTRLGIKRFSVVAISGGGPYAAWLLERVPERIVSVHLAAAAADGELLGQGAAGELLGNVEAIAADPEGFWDYPPGSPVQAIPGFAEACRAEGRRSMGDPRRAAAALRHEVELLSTTTLPYLGGLSARVYMYWGGRDELVGMEHARTWQAALGPNVVLRCFEESGHDVQYVHWKEILNDIGRGVQV